MDVASNHLYRLMLNLGPKGKGKMTTPGPVQSKVARFYIKVPLPMAELGAPSVAIRKRPILVVELHLFDGLAQGLVDGQTLLAQTKIDLNQLLVVVSKIRCSVHDFRIVECFHAFRPGRLKGLAGGEALYAQFVSYRSVAKQSADQTTILVLRAAARNVIRGIGGGRKRIEKNASSRSTGFRLLQALQEGGRLPLQKEIKGKGHKLQYGGLHVGCRATLPTIGQTIEASTLLVLAHFLLKLLKYLLNLLDFHHDGHRGDFSGPEGVPKMRTKVRRSFGYEIGKGWKIWG